jgi:PhoH-like ATPase
MNKIIVDTNLLIDDENILLKLSTKFKKIVIPLTVLKELDKLKNRPDTSYSARRAIKSIRYFIDDPSKKNKIDFYINDSLIDDNDSKIIQASKDTDSILATKDIYMSVLADAVGVPTRVYDIVLNNIYKPYLYINSTELQKECVNRTGDYFCFLQEYSREGGKYDAFLTLLGNLGFTYSKSAWYFIFVTDLNKKYVYAHNPIEGVFERIDNAREYHSIFIDNHVYLNAKDKYQVCAIYALKRAPNTIVTGKWGSGKSLLTTAYSLYKSVNKTFITRAPVGVNPRYNIGFMPGGRDEKMMDWLSGITSSLYYLYANTRNQTNNKGINYDYVKDTIFGDKFDIIPINSIQGLSLLEDDVLLVDEVQLLDIDTMSMVLSRPNENGKLILCGDLNQTYSTLKPSESGLLKLLRLLPHESIAYVELKNSYRSSLLEVADKLQDRTIC